MNNVLECLSVKQREVADLIAAGYRTAAIAAKLGNKQKTIETHREAICSKLGITAELRKVYCSSVLIARCIMLSARADDLVGATTNAE